MSQPLLSILIPTIVEREYQYKELVSSLNKQYNGGEVEIYYIRDNKEMTIGEKRERLYKLANGLFSLQIDDDDRLSGDGVLEILSAIKSNPTIPCITYREKCLINGQYKSSNHSIKYEQWADNFDGFDYVRSPFYKDVIRTDIAKSIPFEYIRWNEDERFSYAIKYLLTDEIHLDKEIYHYIHNSTNPTERYGLDRN